tara:strand:+ start:2559 stop:3191 length:633 start_codon:yes stop_codon:yes gene_type:complete
MVKPAESRKPQAAPPGLKVNKQLPKPVGDLQPALRHNSADFACDARCLDTPPGRGNQEDHAMITKFASHTASRATGRAIVGKFASRMALTLGIGAMVGIGATFAAPAGATELQMPSAKSRLLRDRDDVTIIIIDKQDRRRSRSTSPAKLDLDTVPTPPSSKIRRDEDEVRVYIKRKTGGARKTKKPNPKVIIVDQNRGGCGNSGVCVIRP